MDERSLHLSRTEVRRLVGALETAEGAERRDLMARLAWRPAWAIRSRRGALAAVLELMRGVGRRVRNTSHPSS
jgi:hypothetical protein